MVTLNPQTCTAPAPARRIARGRRRLPRELEAHAAKPKGEKP